MVWSSRARLVGQKFALKSFRSKQVVNEVRIRNWEACIKRILSVHVK